MRLKDGYVRTNLKIAGTVIPIVLLMIVIFFVLTRNAILSLSKDKLSLDSQNYAEDISGWTKQTLSELNIYKRVIEQLGLDNSKAYDIMESSCDAHDAYPYGLYMGDADGNYFDSSGWVPDEDFVVTERDWYIEGLKHDKFTFGEPYVDAMTGVTCVSATVRLEAEDTVSVLAADVYLDYAAELVADIVKGNIERAFFVTGDSRMIVAASNTSVVGKTMDREDATILQHNINRLLDEDKIGQSEVEGDNGDYVVDIHRVDNTDWYFVTCMNRTEILKELRHVETIMVAVAVVAALLLIIVTLRFAKEMSEVKRKAKTDPLTKLLNRDGFKEMMLLALETNPEQGVLLIIDMDNFKQVNDQMGHPEGDAVLKKFAGMLEGYFNRNKDIVARIGGDEFAVFVGREVSEDEVDAMLKKFIVFVHNDFKEEYPEQNLSASIGAAFLEKGEGYAELYKNADRALYDVKRKGKDGYHVNIRRD